MKYDFTQNWSARRRRRDIFRESADDPASLHTGEDGELRVPRTHSTPPEPTRRTTASRQSGGEFSPCISMAIACTALLGAALICIIAGFIAVALEAIGRADPSATPEVLRGLAALVRALLRLPHLRSGVGSLWSRATTTNLRATLCQGRTALLLALQSRGRRVLGGAVTGLGNQRRPCPAWWARRRAPQQLPLGHQKCE